MNLTKRYVLSAILLVFLGCAKEDPGFTGSGSGTGDNVTGNTHTNYEFNILFVGNSLTYTNNLPGMVAELGKANGIAINAKSIAYPNYAIIDHWDDGQVQTEIAENDFDYVIIQQGPSSQEWGRQILIEYGEKYARLCKENGAELCFFMVWPSLEFYETFPGVIKNYRDAATINQSILLPVGEVWKKYFDETNNFDYYGSDGFHPSPKGSERAAQVIFDTLF